MQKLYMLSMAGSMYYLLGTLSLQEANELNKFSSQYKVSPSEYQNNSCDKFIREVKLHLNIDLQQVFITQVFRVER